ncbi:MFS transporter [Cedecea neteri]|uniref:MFS transporter n=1 Tax=Cedecea neteri TaxID=158822 RepID=UPI002AA60649|nr:MFS transporter [Cedecea neteri]WPU21945.1 MFS transporter [Cedecea neteri]
MTQSSTLTSRENAHPAREKLALLALALGSFAIGTSEFASMGILQLFSKTLLIDVSTATHAITAYAMGVVIGAPLITLTAARLNRRTLLLCLMALFVVGNLLSSQVNSIAMLTAARFITGLAQGAYFGAGAVVATYIVGVANAGTAFSLVVSGLTIAMVIGSPLATFLGQSVGWRNTYLVVALLGALALAALWLWTPRSAALNGSPVKQEFSALARGQVWIMMLVAALCVSSIFAVYTFIGPFVTDVAHLAESRIPVALALFGIGMAVGNVIGGHMADRFTYRGMVLGFLVALVVLAILAINGANASVLMAAMFGVGLTTMSAIPTIQVRLTRLAPDAPTLMGAMNMASLNVANALGAWFGGLVIAQGFGLLSAVWVGFGLTIAGLLVFLVGINKSAASPSV